LICAAVAKANTDSAGRTQTPDAMESDASEGWWFVVGGQPGLALSFFFGDEFGS
jgi:hypothetical protein